MTPEEKLQWNVNRNLNISIQGNQFENAVLKMAAILSRPQQVNKLRPRQKIAAILQTSFSNAFSSMEVFELLEPMMTQFNDAYMRYSASTSSRDKFLNI